MIRGVGEMGHNSAVHAFIVINVIIFLYAITQKLQFSNIVKDEINNVLKRLGFGTFNERGTLKVLEQTKDAFKSSQIMNAYWNSFNTTLVATDEIKKEPIYSSQESSDFFNIENLMNDSSKMVSFSIWNAVPQILTSIGIIGTFFSILLSLSLPTGAKIDETFILELVRSLATGFYSSLCGIFLAVVFIVAEKYKTKSINTELSKINNCLNIAFPKLTPEAMLVKQSNILQNLSVDIQTSISNGFSEMSGGLGSALADVLDDETKKTIKEGVANSFIEMNAILAEIRNEAKVLKDELGELRNTKLQMFESIKKITEDQNKIQTEINKQSANLVENLSAFEKTMQPLTEVAKQVHSTNELSDKLIQSVKNVSDASTQIGASLTRSEEISNNAIQKVSELSGKISSEYSGLGGNIENWVKQSNSALENNLKEFDKSIGSVLNQVVTLSNSFNTGVISLERTVNKLEASSKVAREA